jgi:hypothetical protein
MLHCTLSCFALFFWCFLNYCGRVRNWVSYRLQTRVGKTGNQLLQDTEKWRRLYDKVTHPSWNLCRCLIVTALLHQVAICQKHHVTKKCFFEHLVYIHLCWSTNISYRCSLGNQRSLNMKLLLSKLVFPLCRYNSVQCYEFQINFYTGKIWEKQLVCQEVVDLAELTWCWILMVITGPTLKTVSILWSRFVLGFFCSLEIHTWQHH